jgi:Flp pilus assembly protein TadG
LVHCGNRGKVKDESGQVLVLAAVLMVVFIAFAGFAIDVGHAYLVQRQLQSATDAAALAGALDLPVSAQAIQTAKDYGPEPTKRNTLHSNDNATIDVQTKCVTAIVTGCTPANGQVNSITVKSTSVVKTVFAKVIGFDSFTVKANATACSPCSVKPLDIMLVLDRTGSMCQKSDGSSDAPACIDMVNAKDGMKTFLGLMNPQFHSVGLAVLPPVVSAATQAGRCATPSGNTTYDNQSSNYLLVGLSKDYASSPGNLNFGSDLVSTIDCVQSTGRTAYADAIDAAQKELADNGRPGVQKTIIFLSDGAANYGGTWHGASSPYRTTPCHQGVTSSNLAKAAGTTVYAIGYDLNGSGTDFEQCHPATGPTGPNVNLEQPPITSFEAMGGVIGVTGIASSFDTFYNQPNPGKLNLIFKSIAADIFRTAQLIDDSLT